MSGMKDLFGDTPYKAHTRRTDPETSHAAAKAVNDDVSAMENAVYQAIASTTFGLTWDECAKATGIDKGTVSPRFKPLREKGLIEWRHDADGKIIKRPSFRQNKRGRCRQIVWFAKRK